jgi:parallel beta-helix repeat protein
MKKLIYLIVLIVAFGLIVPGCIPVVPPSEQSNIDNLTKGPILNVPFPHATIQDAIDAAATSGDTIIVADGTYTITAAINVNKGVIITGNITNPENVLVKYSSAVTDKNCFDITADNVKVQGIKAIKGNRGFFLNSVTGCKVSNCIVSSCADQGIYVRKCAATSEAERVEVTSNVISDCGNTWGAACIQTYGSPYTYIYNNTINATNDKGINIIRSSATGTADRIQVIGNTISETKWPGIQVIGSPYTYVYDNTLTGCNYQGADETGDWDYASIHVQDDDQVSPTVIGDHVIIDSNTVSDGINGIQTWANDVTITNNEI